MTDRAKPEVSGDLAGLVERLRAVRMVGIRQGKPRNHDGPEAAAVITALVAERDGLRAELEWYGEQARLARLIHSEGDAGRNALASDGGKRARTALTSTR